LDLFPAAHFNPVVSIADAIERGLSWSDAFKYSVAQCFGGFLGTILANAMFALPLVSWSRHARNGPAQLLSEFVAAFGLLCAIWGCSRSRSGVVPFAVAAYITAAYWFTASTSFANPAVTIARAFSDSFAGIRPQDVIPFVLVQFAGGVAATFLFRWLVPNLQLAAHNVVLPHRVDE
jgi:glycerol uptake facilitator-like aquaporin